MPSTAAPTEGGGSSDPSPEPHDGSSDPPDATGPGSSGRRVRRRPGLGIGPVGFLLATMFAAFVALGFVWLVTGLAGDGTESVDVQEALDALDTGPVVPEGSSTAAIGDAAPDVRFDFLPPDGGQETLDALLARTGTPVVLNFWSSTCAPCLEEMPAFQEVSAAATGKVTVVGVDVQDTEQAGREMVQRTGVRYRNARDPRGEIFAVFGGTALPRTVLVGTDGEVLDAHTGALSAEELTDLLSRNGVEI